MCPKIVIIYLRSIFYNSDRKSSGILNESGWLLIETLDTILNIFNVCIFFARHALITYVLLLNAVHNISSGICYDLS